MGFDTLLIANRGEIACRIIRAARALGLRSIAVYSDADANAPHVALADMAVRIGPAPAAESYLDGARILAAARDCGAGAIHPGYGFLSENADFARDVEAQGLVFIGPPARAIEVMGDKAAAKQVMEEAGVACLPGYHGAEQDEATLLKEAAKIGFPLMVKAAAGGGGKGMRRVERPDDLAEALERARAEAVSAFGDDRLILERAATCARHVEIQVFADAHGNCIHLGERDCSLQRRHQKVIEEAPAPGMSEEMRASMGAAAVRAAQAVGYRGAGTVEFLLEADGHFWFLEMNTRLQVEHPVTEMVTGRDLVAMQIEEAQGASLALKQAQVEMRGHAIEARLYAEDAARDFLPVTGRIALWRAARGEGLRVDAGVQSGSEVTPHYDPMLAKLVAWGETREDAIARLRAALEETACLGLVTNAGFLTAVLGNARFAAGEVSTAFLEEEFPQGYRAGPPAPRLVAGAAALIMQARSEAAWARSLMADRGLIGFASDGGLALPLDLELNGKPLQMQAKAAGPGCWEIAAGAGRHDICIEAADGNSARLRIDGCTLSADFAQDGRGGIFLKHGMDMLHLTRRATGRGLGERTDDGTLRAPMPGQVVVLNCAPGEKVEEGQVLAVLEAMKMQHQLVAPTRGVVAELPINEGAQVSAGQALARIVTDEEEGQ